nr:BAG-associated GRAM protein 1-like isoform X2 [Ipomoea batatas]
MVLVLEILCGERNSNFSVEMTSCQGSCSVTVLVENEGPTGAIMAIHLDKPIRAVAVVYLYSMFWNNKYLVFKGRARFFVLETEYVYMFSGSSPRMAQGISSLFLSTGIVKLFEDDVIIPFGEIDEIRRSQHAFINLHPIILRWRAGGHWCATLRETLMV